MCVGLLIIGILPPNPIQVENSRLKKSIRVELGSNLFHQFQTISRRGMKLFLNIWNFCGCLIRKRATLFDNLITWSPSVGGGIERKQPSPKF
jgi:hypothetical protein